MSAVLEMIRGSKVTFLEYSARNEPLTSNRIRARHGYIQDYVANVTSWERS